MRYHSSIVNSGLWRAPRSRLRQTCENAAIRVSPAASSFFIANSGEVCRYIRRATPSLPIASVAKACRCASFPGLVARAAGSTSVKPWASSQARIAACARFRASRSGRRSAWRRGFHHAVWDGVPVMAGEIRWVALMTARYSTHPQIARKTPVKVIASSLRKGNVVELDGKLYVVLIAQNFHPGKGTPVTQVDMRRIADGVKVSERWRTTEQVERAHVDERAYDFLYEDGEGFHFMEPESYEQLVAPADMVGDQKAYLQEGMRLFLQVYNGVPIVMTLPQRITVEITETEPVVKGQTASSSYKPATVDNGLRVMVPPHIGVGTRIVINTEDNSYVERAKD